MHGTNPAICKHGCKPVLPAALGETAEQKLWREAAEFVDQYAFEMALPDEVSFHLFACLPPLRSTSLPLPKQCLVL